MLLILVWTFKGTAFLDVIFGNSNLSSETIVPRTADPETMIQWWRTFQLRLSEGNFQSLEAMDASRGH